MSDFDPITLETQALAAIDAVLSKPENKEGITAARIARQIGVAIGYVDRLLKDSTSVYKRVGLKWVIDWSSEADWQEWQRRSDYHAPGVVWSRRVDGSLVRYGTDKSVIVVPNVFRTMNVRK